MYTIPSAQNYQTVEVFSKDESLSTVSMTHKDLFITLKSEMRAIIYGIGYCIMHLIYVNCIAIIQEHSLTVILFRKTAINIWPLTPVD